eukprot:Skav204909  [mRNA]  locus=scaffold1926:365351:369120:+ [translate_table: standard]
MVLVAGCFRSDEELLGSILGALKAIVNVIGMTKMTPPIKDQRSDKSKHDMGQDPVATIHSSMCKLHRFTNKQDFYDFARFAFAWVHLNIKTITATMPISLL